MYLSSTPSVCHLVKSPTSCPIVRALFISISQVMLSKVLATKERKCYICNVFSPWWACLARSETWIEKEPRFPKCLAGCVRSKLWVNLLAQWVALMNIIVKSLSHEILNGAQLLIYTNILHRLYDLTTFVLVVRSSKSELKSLILCKDFVLIW